MSANETHIDVFGATLTRGKFVKGAGALVVALGVPMAATGKAAAAANELDGTLLSSWITINPDNTVWMRTGKYEFGQGTASAAYAQILAEELNIPFSSITKIIMGDTDRTPDGGIGAGLLGGGATNIRKIGAYTYQALLSVASTALGVPGTSLSVKDGVVSGGGKTITYGELVKNQAFKLTIPITGTPLDGVTVAGTPPTKPTSQYTVIGTSQPMASIPPIVAGTATYVANVRLPGMLHARMVRPKTYGSTLVEVGKLDKKAWPTAQVFVKGNLVAVLSPKEWEAVGAAASVAGKTKWSDWTGLPGSGNIYKTLRERDYSGVARNTQSTGNAGAALATAAKRMSATYLKPYIKHGPIGPSVAVADVKKDGSTTVWAHTQYPQHLRKMLAPILGVGNDKVVVRVLDGSGHYGRSNPGPDGAEADAAILSQAIGRPVKVQWTREEDMAWSTSGFPQLADIQLGLDTNGNIIAYQGDYHQTGRYDGRGLGALLAGLPPGAMEDNNPRAPQVLGHYSWVAAVSAVWPYEKVTNVLQIAHNSPPLGTVESPYNVGMRIHSFRTPVMREQAYALESMVNEAAAAIGVDPIDYRLRHTADPRLVNVLNTLKAAHGWESRPSPKAGATATGSKSLTGRGMGVMLRSNARWAAAADVTITPSTGKVTVDKYTVVLDPGIVINPLQLRRITEGGTVQGISEVMKEGVAYDKGIITSKDWVQYPIMRFVDMPEIKVVLINNTSVGAYNGAGEGSNGLPYVSIPAAIHDATGKFPRQLPLRPANVRAMLKA